MISISIFFTASSKNGSSIASSTETSTDSDIAVAASGSSAGRIQFTSKMIAGQVFHATPSHNLICHTLQPLTWRIIIQDILSPGHSV